MNINEECLLSYLNNPQRLDFMTSELKKFIFSLNNNIILSNDIIRDKVQIFDVK